MPYIKQEVRAGIDDSIDELMMSILKECIRQKADLEGVMNYTLTSLLLRTYQELHGAPRYAHFNNIIGVLECCKLEMYRRAAAPYEDKAKRTNNDLGEFIEWGA